MGKCGKWGADLGCSRVYRGCETSRAREFSPSTLRTIFRMHRARKVRWTRKVNYSGCLVTTTDCNTRGKCLGCQSCWETTLLSIGIRIFFSGNSPRKCHIWIVFSQIRIRGRKCTAFQMSRQAAGWEGVPAASWLNPRHPCGSKSCVAIPFNHSVVL